MKQEILRLFKGYLGDKATGVSQKALSFGLVIPDNAPEAVVESAISMYGKDGVLWNQTFHKDWKKVATAPIMQLVLEQIMHYFTTYGFEIFGCYSDDTVYIPTEELNVPDLDPAKIKLITIKPMTEAEVSEKMMTLVTSGIALSDQTVKDIQVLSDFIDKDRFDEVSNREVRTFLYDKYNIMPKNPEAFLRYLMFKATGATLKIQNVSTYKALQASDKALVLKMLESYGAKTGYDKLSSIFLRNKNLFLAFKTKDAEAKSTEARVNTVINKLAKLAKTNHRPLTKSVLDSITTGERFGKKVLNEALDKVTTFRKIRLLNALRYRINGNDDIVYRVRNGKSYVSKIEGVKPVVAMTNNYEVIEASLLADLSSKVSGKTVYIPTGFVYKAPTTEKQFIGDIPEGSYYELPENKDLIFAVHWMNLHNSKATDWESESRVDLDLHAMNQSAQFGWNTSWRDESRNILFSGDVTSAPAPYGATEAFSIGRDAKNVAYLATLNDFNGHREEVPFEFIIAEGKVKSGSRMSTSNYMIDPNTIVAKFNMKIAPDKRQVTLGMVKADNLTKRFYFNNYAVGASCAVSSRNNCTLGALSYMEAYSELQVSLNDLLEKAGAIIVRTPTVPMMVEKRLADGSIERVREEVPVDIDLSIENISKDTIIGLFTK